MSNTIRKTESSLGLYLMSLLILNIGCYPSLMPTPNLFIDTPEDPFAAVDPALQTNYVDLLYVTNRGEDVDKKGRRTYNSKRSKSVAFGTCRVTCGKNLSWKQMVEASRQKNALFHCGFAFRK